jgi:hypothetical protein
MLWGRVFDHEHGWRAEFAYPLGLYSVPTRPEAAQRIERLLDMYTIPSLSVPSERNPLLLPVEPSDLRALLFPLLRPGYDDPPLDVSG